VTREEMLDEIVDRLEGSVDQQDYLEYIEFNECPDLSFEDYLYKLAVDELNGLDVKELDNDVEYKEINT
jgi:hypothetical protein